MDSHDGIPAPHCGILGTSPHISYFWGGGGGDVFFFGGLTNVGKSS